MHITTRKLTAAAVTGAAYAALTMLLAPISYGAIQCRVSEVLCILPFFIPCTAWGLFAGCAIANLLSAAGIFDVVFGSLATLLAALCTAWLGRGRGAQSWVRCILAALMPVVFNFMLVGAVLTWSLTDAVFPHLNASFWVFGGQVALGEVIVLGVLGLPLMRLLPRNPKFREIIRGAAKRYDVVRLDHFRAISSYWVVPRGELTARGGHWAPGPGPALLQALHTAAPELELIAEDLGTIDDDVRRLVARSGCPGMRVLLFGFDPSGTSEHRPDRVRAHSVCYVGTHDNAPAAAWAALGGADADYAMRCLGVYDVARLPEALLRTGMGSRAELFIAQMQDVLGLGAESRMNTPGTAAGNWVWRLLPGQADAQTAARLLARTQAACRA